MGIDEGGEIGFIDLGHAALVVRGGVAVARQELRRVLKDRYEAGLASIADPDVADQFREWSAMYTGVEGP